MWHHGIRSGASTGGEGMKQITALVALIANSAANESATRSGQVRRLRSAAVPSSRLSRASRVVLGLLLRAALSGNWRLFAAGSTSSLIHYEQGVGGAALVRMQVPRSQLALLVDSGSSTSILDRETISRLGLAVVGTDTDSGASEGAASGGFVRVLGTTELESAGLGTFAFDRHWFFAPDVPQLVVIPSAGPGVEFPLYSIAAGSSHVRRLIVIPGEHCSTPRREPGGIDER